MGITAPDPDEHRADPLATAAVAVTVLLWASSFSIVRVAGEHLSPGRMTLLRVSIAALVLWPIAIIARECFAYQDPAVARARSQAGESFLDDDARAQLVQEGIRDLARHSGAYAAVLANKPGARLAHHVAVGYVAQLSESGRVALADLYRLTQIARTVEPGLDTNTFVDRVTGRRDPRREHAS